ncbi:MAG: tyrosine-type recombinase/integrase [Hyphomonadaceae bacterium]|nr:tyrosine-type recombinase/integrase [Hyphomonadaceae bacterium]
MDECAPGKQVYDDQVSGLRIVVGKKSASFKLVGFLNDGTGRYFSSMIGRTDEVSLKTARTRAIDLKQKARQGVDPRKPKSTVPTLDEALQRYLDSRGASLQPRTRDWYAEKVQGPLSSLRKLPVDRIDREQVRALHERITKKNGPACANGSMRTLKLLLNDVARTVDLPANPVSRAVRLNEERPRDWSVAPDDMPELWRRLDAMSDRVRRACWLLMLTTGLRCHDARSMKWAHIDADGIVTLPSPKGGPSKAFKLPLPRLFLQALEEVRELTKPFESEYVFASAVSKSGYIEQMRRTDEFGWAPHAMRHTYRCYALEAGIDFQTITLLMNHANPHVSFNYITRHNMIGHMAEMQEKVCAKLVSYRRSA